MTVKKYEKIAIYLEYLFTFVKLLDFDFTTKPLLKTDARLKHSFRTRLSPH